jgi:hypothetical protein
VIITIVLITKGRPDFINDALTGIDNCLSLPGVKALILDNGSIQNQEIIIRNWCLERESKAELVRIPTNTIQTSQLWKHLQGRNLDWVVMPGDDDILDYKIFEEVFQIINKNSEIVAIGASAKDADGANFVEGGVLNPSIHNMPNFENRLASIFHEPPFIWPSLFFNFGSLPNKVPNSRFVFDWWVGNQLLITGPIATINSPALFYRRHPGQESNAAPNRRKFAEANLMLGDLVLDSRFRVRVKRMSDEEVKIFWKDFLGKSPIYGNDKYFHSLSSQLLRVLEKDFPHIQDFFLAEYASKSGFFMKSEDYSSFYGSSQTGSKSLNSNVELHAAGDLCPEMLQLVNSLSTTGMEKRFNISCNHGKSRTGIRVNCRQLLNLTEPLRQDFLLKEITLYLESTGELDLSITTGERELIRFFRMCRRWFPRNFIRFARRILSGN